MKPKVLIAGAGETGAYLARRLCENWDVVVVDPDAGSLQADASQACGARYQGDATSALVLRKAGIEGARVVVACAGDDETNLEVLRLARQEFAVTHLYAVLERTGVEQQYLEHGAEVVDRSQACAALLESRIEGRTVATSIGLGEGEIQQVEVLPNSSVIGQRLADLRPRRWLVGAVYREGQLVVPHGDTVIQQGDRVLLIGQPDVLSAVATHIGAGESEFPLHYGSTVVALGAPGLEHTVDEISYLLQTTAARLLQVLPATSGGEDPLAQRCAEANVPVQVLDHQAEPAADLAQQIATADAGVVLLAPRPLPWLSRIGLARSPTARALDQLNVPALIPRGTFPYARVLLVLAEPEFPAEAAQVAIDLVRKVGARLVLGLAHQPEVVVGAQRRQELEERQRQVEDLASMYHVDVEHDLMEGNPIAEVLARCKNYNLLVLPFARGQRASLTRPDVNLNLLHRASCSVLVMPY